MKLFHKYGLALLTSLLSISLFAYNGGYENSLDYAKGPYDGCAGYGNYSLTAREESGTAIADNKYAQCKKLKSVSLANVTSIGNAAFAYSALTSVTIPSTVKTMGYIAFGGCTNLTTATIETWNWYTANAEPFRDTTALKTVMVSGNAATTTPAFDLKTVFPALTTIKCPSANKSAWTTYKSSYADMKSVTIADANPTYTVCFNSNDGESKTYNQVMSVGKTETMPYMSSQIGWTRSGWVFSGWSKSATATVSSYVNGQKVTDLTTEGKTINLYAVWIKSDSCYLVNFNRNDGTTGKSGQVLPSGTTSSLLYMSSQLGWTRSGYVFSGWSKSATATVASYVNGQKVKDLAAAGKTINLYAVWLKSDACYMVNLNRNDGTTGKSGQVLPCGTSSSLLYMSSQLGWTRSGYVFSGWSKSPTATVASYVNGQKVKDLAAAGKTINLYAVWLKSDACYIVNLNRNDGTTGKSGQVLASGVEASLLYMSSQLGWTYPGYTFTGWARSATATTAEFTNGQKVKDLAAAGKSINLYAVWKKNAKSLAVAPKTVSVGSSGIQDASSVSASGYYVGELVDGSGTYELLIDEGGLTGYVKISVVGAEDFCSEVELIVTKEVIVAVTGEATFELAR